mgnify:CR=1 FL=1
MCREHQEDQPALPGPGLAEIFREHAVGLPTLSQDQRKAVRAIMACRTAAQGSHTSQCSQCGHEETAFNSCWNRNCPKCQGMRQARWLEAREAELLPVAYFHTVFTAPHVLHPFFHLAPHLSYGILMSAAAEALQQAALNPKRLGARIGFMAILHTWTQQLLYHPHVHCVIPGGGLSADGSQWIASKSRYFLPVKVLSKMFRGILLHRLESALKAGAFALNEKAGMDLLRQAARKNWMVYCKPPFHGPGQVLKYLSRYTHKIAISNSRILSFKDGVVTFRYRDRADGNRPKTVSLGAMEFLMRFLLHIVPSGFTRIRYFGFLANGAKASLLPVCRDLLPSEGFPEYGDHEPNNRDGSWAGLFSTLFGSFFRPCPSCKTGMLVLASFQPPARQPWSLPGKATSS